MWLSLVERCVRDAEAAGSNPVIPTIECETVVSSEAAVFANESIRSNWRHLRESVRKDGLMILRKYEAPILAFSLSFLGSFEKPLLDTEISSPCLKMFMMLV